MLYEALCPKCSKLHLYRAYIAERDAKAPKCKDCNTQTIRKISTPMVRVIGPAAG